jgi:two-component system OmpR family sensor kinase
MMRDTGVGRGGHAELESFLGLLSHELRTPVTTIYAGARLLARGEPLSSATRRELASNIGAEAERLFRLIEDLLVIARAERGLLEANRERVALRPLLAEMTRLEATQWPTNPFEVAGDDDLPPVAGDSRFIRQVLRNLLGHVAVLRTEREPVRAWIEQDRETLRVRIVVLPDPAAAPARVAGPPAGLGSGPIGLFAARHLVQAMDGELWVRTDPDASVECGFALPIYRPA